MKIQSIHLVACAALLIVVTSCSKSTIQTDASIKETRSSSAESGPLSVKAFVRMNDGTPVSKRTFQFVTVARDEKGDMKEVNILYSVTADTDGNGNLNFSIPRDQISAGKEFSFNLLTSNSYGAPMIIRRKDAKNILTFKADDKTKSIDLGEVTVPLR